MSDVKAIQTYKLSGIIEERVYIKHKNVLMRIIEKHNPHTRLCLRIQQ